MRKSDYNQSTLKIRTQTLQTETSGDAIKTVNKGKSTALKLNDEQKQMCSYKLYDKNKNNLLMDVKQDLNKQKDTLYSWIIKLKILTEELTSYVNL